MNDLAKLLVALAKQGGPPAVGVLVAAFCIVSLFVLVPYVAQQHGYAPKEAIAAVEITDWSSPIAHETRQKIDSMGNLMSEVHSGSAPRDASFVPFWQRVFQSFDRLISSIDRLAENTAANTEAMRSLAGEIEDRRHRRPQLQSLAEQSGDVTPPSPDPAWAERQWSRFVAWWRGGA